MRKVEELERQISELSNEEFAELRSWLAERDAVSWDAQFEADVGAGKLKALGDAARRSRGEGKSTKL
jgi:hypothetical protein